MAMIEFSMCIVLGKLIHRCSDVEAVFRSAFSLDLLANELDTEWSSCWTRVLMGNVKGLGRAPW